MIRGVNRQIIVVNPGDSDIFDQAIFFVTPRAGRRGVGNADMLAEAERIIRRETAGGQPKKKKFRLFRA